MRFLSRSMPHYPPTPGCPNTPLGVVGLPQGLKAASGIRILFHRLPEGVGFHVSPRSTLHTKPCPRSTALWPSWSRRRRIFRPPPPPELCGYSPSLAGGSSTLQEL